MAGLLVSLVRWVLRSGSLTTWMSSQSLPARHWRISEAVDVAVITACLLLTGCPQSKGSEPSSIQEQVGPDKVNIMGTYSFYGTVAEVIPLASYGGDAILVGNNPQFILHIRDVHPISGSIPSDQRMELRYAIHSPIILFALPTDEIVGRSFKFSAERLKSGSWFLAAAMP